MNPRKEKDSTVTKGIITPVISMNKAKKPHDNLKILPTVGLWHGSRSWELCLYSSTPGKSMIDFVIGLRSLSYKYDPEQGGDQYVRH